MPEPEALALGQFIVLLFGHGATPRYIDESSVRGWASAEKGVVNLSLTLEAQMRPNESPLRVSRPYPLKPSPPWVLEAGVSPEIGESPLLFERTDQL